MDEGKFGETRSRGKIKKMSSTDINNDAEVHLTYPRVIQFAKDRRVVLTCELKETLLVNEIALWKKITQLNLLKTRKQAQYLMTVQTVFINIILQTKHTERTLFSGWIF